MAKNAVAAKIILLGDGAVGKTALVQRWATDKFQSRYTATIGVDICSKSVSLEDGREIRFDAWDIAGQEHFKLIRTKFYKQASGALLVFDVTNKQSFNHLEKWIEETKTIIKTELPFILLGNKVDLDDMRLISTEEIKKKADELGITTYFETSALNGENVKEAFKSLAKVILDFREL
ncbi:MAG: Rab family GTPase [Candidatus Hodarchaeales archaeon]|jgi:small GTP-binding protein